MLDKILKLNIGLKEAEELVKVSKNIESDFKLLKKGYPIQYLIGYVNFYGYEIKVNKSVLIPRYCTEELVSKTINYLKRLELTNPRTLDLCTGSGCISVVLSKENITNDITASDISLKALKTAKINFKSNRCKIKTVQSNMFDNITEEYDLIISNPPYVSYEEHLDKSLKMEPKLALYSKKGTYHIEKIIQNIEKHTKEKAIVALEINSYSNKSITKILKENLDANYSYSFEKDLEDKERFLFIFKNLNK